MPPKVSQSLILEHDHLEYLKQNVAEYSLPDCGKALRCLLSFIVDGTTAETIFSVQRGSHLRYAGKPHEAAKQKEETTFELEGWQQDWLHSAAANESFKLADVNKAARVLMEYALVELKGQEPTIFGVKRCTKPPGVPCDSCDAHAKK